MMLRLDHRQYLQLFVVAGSHEPGDDFHTASEIDFAGSFHRKRMMKNEVDGDDEQHSKKHQSIDCCNCYGSTIDHSDNIHLVVVDMEEVRLKEYVRTEDNCKNQLEQQGNSVHHPSPLSTLEKTDGKNWLARVKLIVDSNCALRLLRVQF